eukprot:1938292-Prymnesium_polylepis.1
MPTNSNTCTVQLQVLSHRMACARATRQWSGECRVCADVRGGPHAGTRPDDPPPVTAAPQGVESPR